jgi:hypothetical protein
MEARKSISASSGRKAYNTTELVVLVALKALIDEKGERVDCGDLLAHLHEAIYEYVPCGGVPSPQYELGGDVYLPLANTELSAGYPLERLLAPTKETDESDE